MTVALEVGFCVGLIAVLAAAWFVGKLLGSRFHAEVAKHPQFGVVQGATFGLLALLLGFCFSGAINRFVDRQQIIVREANAAMTLHTRADLLELEPRARLQHLCAEYIDARLDLFHLSRLSPEDRAQARLQGILSSMWAVTRDGANERSFSTPLVLQACNELSDSLGDRNGAERRHIPGFVLLVLVACAGASIASVGLGVEVSDRRLRLPAMTLVFLIAATLWTTIDLDFPRSGLIRLDPQPLLDAAAAMKDNAN